MTEPLATDVLRRAVAKHVDDAQATFEPIRTGKFNTSYFVSTGEGELVLRIAPPDTTGVLFYERGMMAQEPEVHERVRSNTTVPVADILAYDTQRDVLPRDFLLMRRLPGRALSEMSLSRQATGRVYRHVGEALRQIHDLRRDRYGYLGAHHCMTPQPDWAGAFAIMWNRLLDDVDGCQGYDTRESQFLRDLLEHHMEAFTHEPPSCLLHMDVWAQNILCDAQGNLTGLVDFDRALWGDPEIEFAVLDYCGVSVPEFWQGYGQARDESGPAQVRGLFYYLYELQKYIVIERLRRHNAARADQYRQHVRGIIAQALGREPAG